MVSKELEKAINKQINAEFWSAYLYLSMSTYFSNNGLPGFANEFKLKFEEEQGHAMRLMNYMISKGNRVILEPIEKVKTDWDSTLEVCQETLKHEQQITSMINKLVAMARKDDDYATEHILQWFVAEQIEEEDTAQEMIDSVTLIGDNGFGIYAMDKELGQKSYNAPED